MICDKEWCERKDGKIAFSYAIVCYILSTEGILVSASPTAAHCQHTCKCFTLSIQLYCSTVYNSSHQSILTLYVKKNATTARTLLYAAVHGLPF